jgi:hypothetical protein
MGEKRNAYRLLVGKPEGKRPLGRPRRRWVDNIRMDIIVNKRPLYRNSGHLFTIIFVFIRNRMLHTEIKLGWILERWDGVMRTGLVWLWIGRGGELMGIRY